MSSDKTEEEMASLLNDEDTDIVVEDEEEEEEEAPAPPPRRKGEASVYKMRREVKESVAENVMDMVHKAGLDWGTNYDPFDKFCGPYDCYKILGFDPEKDRDHGVTKKSLTKAYRTSSRKWHPDKNTSPDAKKMFQKISRANDVLGDPERKESYDFYSRSSEDLYHRAFDKKISVRFAPQSSTTFVLLLVFALLSVLSWFMQHLRWSNAVEKTARGAAKRLHEKNGGTLQTREVNEKAQEMLARHKKQVSKFEYVSFHPYLVIFKKADLLHNFLQLKRTKGPTDLNDLITKNMNVFDKVSATFYKLSGWDKFQDADEIVAEKTYLIFASEYKTFGPGLHYPTFKDTLAYILAVTLPKRLLGGKKTEKEA